MSRPEIGGPIWYEQRNPLDRKNPSVLLEQGGKPQGKPNIPAVEFVLGNGKAAVELAKKVSATSLRWSAEKVVEGLAGLRRTDVTPTEVIPQKQDKKALLKRAGVVNTRQERLKGSIKTHEDKIKEAKEDLRTAYAREDMLEVDGKNIFRNSHRGRKDPNEVLEFKIRAIIRADKAAKKERREWRSTLSDEVQKALQKLEDGQRSLRNNKRSQKRYEKEEKKLEDVLPGTAPEKVLGGDKNKTSLKRRAAVFGLVAAAVAVTLFVKDTPQVSDFLKTMVDIRPGVTQAKGEEALPADIKALQKRIDELTESNNAYKAESQERFAQLVEAKMAAAGYIPGELRRIGLENRKLTEQNQSLQKQLDEARAAVPDYPEHRWVDATIEPVNKQPAKVIPPQVQAAFAAYGNGGDYAFKKGDSPAKIAEDVGYSLGLDIKQEKERKEIEKLAKQVALDGDIASDYLGTTGRNKDTALPIGKVINLRGTMALAAEIIEG